MAEQDPQEPEEGETPEAEAAAETPKTSELKVVIVIKDDRIMLGVQSPNCDPVYTTLQGTIAEAHHLFAALNRPNVMIKVPATPAGIPAIEALIGEGINVNVTLMFSLAQYEAVAEAYSREHPGVKFTVTWNYKLKPFHDEKMDLLAFHGRMQTFRGEDAELVRALWGDKVPAVTVAWRPLVALTAGTWSAGLKAITIGSTVSFPMLESMTCAPCTERLRSSGFRNGI